MRCRNCLRPSFDRGSNRKLAVNCQECEGVTSSLRSSWERPYYEETIKNKNKNKNNED